MKNVHIIPTDKPSRLRIGDNRNFVFGLMQSAIVSKNDSFTNQHIYITSDEEITGFEINIWVIKGDRIFLWQNTMALVSNNKPKKIILTTDQDLIKDGVQAIEDEFLEWFVNNPSCEEVEIQCRYNFYVGQDLTHYKIIIPKEENRYRLKGGSNAVFSSSTAITFYTKQEITPEEDLGTEILNYCKKYKGTDKYNVAMLAMEFGYQLALKEEPKQEITLEEDLLNTAIQVVGDNNITTIKEFLVKHKWQQERMV